MTKQMKRFENKVAGGALGLVMPLPVGCMMKERLLSLHSAGRARNLIG
ncbi:hypothetical protein MKY30_13030 [Oceanobacillus sp. FSL W8-0428]